MSKPELFIIESLSFDDERENRYEGRIISQILALGGKACEYYYFRTERELRELLTLFRKTSYRYLHLSCHGNSEAMDTTLDEIKFRPLAKALTPYLKRRRLFVSACGMTNKFLARQLMPGSGCYSILGSHNAIEFKDAAILWASLYHVMFAADRMAMKGDMLQPKAQEVVDMFRVELNLFRHDASNKKPFLEFTLAPRPE